MGPVLPPPLCEDADAVECARLTNPQNGSLASIPEGCSPQSTGRAALRCPKSCGLCAVVLADCRRVDILDAGSCVEGEDVVGEVCSGDGKADKEAYCTWLPVNHSGIRNHGRSGSKTGTHKPQLQFVCAHCADERMSAERRALLGQMLELRLEEDGREASELMRPGADKETVQSNIAAVAERNAYVVHR